MDMTAEGVNLHDLVARRCSPDQGWLVFYEVPNGTGFTASRRADALALQTWPSKGIQLVGFEIKRSRGDLITELKQEDKANAFQKYCTAWWLVVHDAKICEGLEIPVNWGILAPKRGVLYQVRPAPKLVPEEWKISFAAALIRSGHEATVGRSEAEIKRAIDTKLKAEVDRQVAMREKHGRASSESDLVHYKSQYEALKKSVDDFQARSGLNIGTWNGGMVGDAVRVLMEHKNYPQLRRQLVDIRDGAERISKSMKGALANLQQMEDVRNEQNQPSSEPSSAESPGRARQRRP